MPPAEEKIRTKHPEAKRGVNISRAKYALVREAILERLRGGEPPAFNELAQHVESKLKDRFDGSIRWYTESVKLDLEARTEIERIADAKPRRYQLLRT